MENYYISDLHLFHNNILKLCNRPFRDMEEMHRTIYSKWTHKVSNEDIVYLLGDVSMGHPDKAAEFVNALPGKKILISGNHDYRNMKNQEFRKAFMEIVPYKEIADRNRRIILFHYPMEEWNGFFRGSYHLFGHVHNNDKKLLTIPRRYNVSADILDYEPMTLDEIIIRSNQ